MERASNTTTGYFEFSVWQHALYSNIQRSADNTATGLRALYSTTLATTIRPAGSYALYSNTTVGTTDYGHW